MADGSLITKAMKRELRLFALAAGYGRAIDIGMVREMAATHALLKLGLIVMRGNGRLAYITKAGKLALTPQHGEDRDGR